MIMDDGSFLNSNLDSGLSWLLRDCLIRPHRESPEVCVHRVGLAL